MLRKLNGNITKLLFYIKNNLVSCAFKFSIFSTMLILVYLVCVLSQSNSLDPNDNSAVYPMENSEKLMLTIPTEMMEDSITDYYVPISTTETLKTAPADSINEIENITTENSYEETENPATENEKSIVENEISTTEKDENVNLAIENEHPVEENDNTDEECEKSVTENESSVEEKQHSTTEQNDSSFVEPETQTTDTQNSIPKHDGPDFLTDSSFPMQESMTTPLPFQEKDINDKEEEEEIEIDDSPVQTSTTEENEVTTTSTEQSTTEGKLNTETEYTENTNQETSTTETMPSSLTPIMIDPDMPEVGPIPTKRSLSPKELKMFQQAALEATTNAELEMPTSTLPSLDNSENLTEEISTNALTSTHSNEVQDSQNTSPNPVSSTSPKTANDDLFVDNNWTNYLAEDDALQEDSHLDLDIIEPNKSLFKNDNIELPTNDPPTLKNESDSTPLPLLEKPTESEIEYPNNAQYYDTEESQPIFSPTSLLNLFAFDHEPSSSNHRAMWWPKPKSSSMSLLGENAAKNQQKRDNQIPLNDDSEELDVAHQGMFGHRFNRKLKNSVSMLERLFGNYFLQ